MYPRISKETLSQLKVGDKVLVALRDVYDEPDEGYVLSVSQSAIRVRHLSCKASFSPRTGAGLGNDARYELVEIPADEIEEERREALIDAMRVRLSRVDLEDATSVGMLIDELAAYSDAMFGTDRS